MQKREKILIILMAAAVLVGGFMVLSGKNRSTPSAMQVEEQATTEASEVQDSVNAFLAKASSLQGQRALLTKSQTALVPDPFLSLSKEAFRAKGEGGAEEVHAFSFNGFIDTGSRRVAIIDGREYAVGDLLESGGYTVAQIDPDKVILKNKATGAPLSVPYAGPAQ